MWCWAQAAVREKTAQNVEPYSSLPGVTAKSIQRYLWVSYFSLCFQAPSGSCHHSNKVIRSALLPNHKTRSGMHSCNLLKYSLSGSSDFKHSLWEIIFRVNLFFFFFKVHLIKVRHLSYRRIIDYDKHFELTQCFSSQNLLIFCCKWNGGKLRLYMIHWGYSIARWSKTSELTALLSLRASTSERPFVAFV